MSPPLAYEVPGGYRVGENSGIQTETGLLSCADILANASGQLLAIVIGDSDESAKANAAMIVACLNRVQP